jgi:hypothetical protein
MDGGQGKAVGCYADGFAVLIDNTFADAIIPSGIIVG